MEINTQEYAAIALRLDTYEERVRLRKAELDLRKAQTIEKLKSLGISEEEIAALTAAD